MGCYFPAMKCLFICLFLISSTAFGSLEETRILDFWSSQRRGANVFTNRPNSQRFRDAKKAGIHFLRIAPNKWLNGRPKSERGNFLLGPKDKYSGLIKADVDYLRGVLDKAETAKMKIVLTMLSLPGSRWSQHNLVSGKRTQERKLWKDFKYHKQSAYFWGSLAKELKGHPALVGYNIINEPSPELVQPKLNDWFTESYSNWSKSVEGSPADINLLYRDVIKSIRQHDKNMPIILDSGFYATPYGLTVLKPGVLGDSKLIFSFHGYVPFRYAFNKLNFTYPGMIPTGELSVKGSDGAEPPYAPMIKWDAKQIASFYRPILKWTTRYKISPNRIFAGEFGVYRQSSGAKKYLKDIIKFFNENSWHWAFYSFREDDGFQQMDYELGTEKLNWKYWECSEKYTCEREKVYKSNSLWQLISSEIKGLGPK